MNNSGSYIFYRKAGFFTCLFLSLTTLSLAQDWKFSDLAQKAYELALDLQCEKALQILPHPTTPEEMYVVNLAQALDLFVSEDPEKYEIYHDAYEDLLDQQFHSDPAKDLFVKAEMRLLWTFVYMKFDHPLDAAWNLRQTYLLTKDCKKRFPGFEPIKKTTGLTNIMVGSVPEKYGWILGLLGIEGSIARGLKELTSLSDSENPFSFEAILLYATAQAYILQQTEQAANTLQLLQQQHPGNTIINFLGAAILIKNSQSEEALRLIHTSEKSKENNILPHLYYLKGEANLHKGDYLDAVAAYQSFITLYKGQNFLKDAYYKIGICHLLEGKKNEAQAAFEKAAHIGIAINDADKHAARNLEENKLPHIGLTRVRYYTDGGYYPEAKKIIDQIPLHTLKDHELIEYYYRKARLAHKTNDFTNAKAFYHKVIETSGGTDQYYAPNSCLQMGYLLWQEGDIEKARVYFEKTFQYQRHPYKNSIDSKAKSALAQLNPARRK